MYEADHSLVYSAEIKNECSYRCVTPTRIHDVATNSFTLSQKLAANAVRQEIVFLPKATNILKRASSALFCKTSNRILTNMRGHRHRHHHHHHQQQQQGLESDTGQCA